ncbi:MAG TPA: BlaI/MecI/CopY family transcriptional regulator [Trebonia sp.]|jgi:predicted transcriptional regulator
MPDGPDPGGADGAAHSRRPPGELEAAVLRELQRAGEPLSPGEVRERIGGSLAYTTVVTILSRLHVKGLLSRHKSGRVYRYAPVADQPGLAARRMARVLDEEADREAVLARFVSSLSGRDEELLRKMLAAPELADAAPAGSLPADPEPGE